jgi:hypothetical protein
MTTLLAQRKYHLAARLTKATAKTFGLAFVALFLIVAVVEEIVTVVNGFAQETSWVLLSWGIPVTMVAIAWTHLSRSFPAAITNGMTRKETLNGFALFGAVTVLVSAVFTHAAVVLLDFGPFTETVYPVDFYGLSLLESVVRPALYFGVGAAAAAMMHRVPSRALGAVLGGLLVVATVYRVQVIGPVLYALGPQSSSFSEMPDRSEIVLRMSTFAWIDVALAAILVLLTVTLLAKAPMRPKEI